MAIPGIFRRLFQNNGMGPMLRADIIPSLPSIPAGGVITFTGVFGGSDGKRPIPRGSTAADEGWVLCDGTNGTPDMRDRFIVGAGGKYAVGAVGGAETHSHTVSGSAGATTLSAAQMPSHGHTFSSTWTEAGGNYGGDRGQNRDSAYSTNGAGGSGSHTHSLTVSSAAASTLPPYRALSYIMKL